MVRFFVLVVGVALIAGVAVVAAHTPLPASAGGFGGAPERIEARLQAAAEAALAERGLDWARVEMDGQIAVLRGEAPVDEERAAARAAVAAADGPGGFLQGGVVSVLDMTALAPPISPFEWSARRTPDGGVALTGAAPTRALRSELVEYAQTLFGGNVADTMIVARGAPDQPGWTTAARTGLAQLAALETGRVVLKDTRLRIDGVASNPAARDRVRAAITALPRPYDVAVARLDVGAGAAAAPEPPAAPEDDAEIVAAITDPALCQDAFDALLDGEQVLFASGLGVIEKESYALLDRLVIAARRCGDMAVEVVGHTDNQGDPDANQRLSEKRARAVADYFILQGVRADRLSATGRGDAEPIADNETEDGRDLNRRIEFNIGR